MHAQGMEMEMKRPGSWLLAAGLALSGAAHSREPVQVRLIGINDFHGNLLSPGNFGGKPSGGADYLAGYVAAEKLGHPNNVVVAAGEVLWVPGIVRSHTGRLTASPASRCHDAISASDQVPASLNSPTSIRLAPASPSMTKELPGFWPVHFTNRSPCT
jgi:hypothetical protein